MDESVQEFLREILLKYPLNESPSDDDDDMTHHGLGSSSCESGEYESDMIKINLIDELKKELTEEVANHRETAGVCCIVMQ